MAIMPSKIKERIDSINVKPSLILLFISVLQEDRKCLLQRHNYGFLRAMYDSACRFRLSLLPKQVALVLPHSQKSKPHLS